MRRALALAIAAGVLAGPACLPKKRASRHGERLYTTPMALREDRPRPTASPAVASTGVPRSAPIPLPMAEIEFEEDEFTRTTSVTVRDTMRPHGVTVSLIAMLPGFRTGGGALMFSTFSANWRYLECHHVDMLVDGEPFTIPREEHDGRVSRNGVIEHVSVDLDADAFRSLLHATEIRARICRDDWTFSAPMMRSLAHVRARLYPEPAREEAQASGQPPDQPRPERD